MPNRLKDIVNGVAGAIGEAGRRITQTVTQGAQIANDTGKAVVDAVDQGTKPAREFASKAGETAVEGVRTAGKVYVNNRERIDAAMIAYPVGQTIASSAIARGISAKLLGMVGLGASAGVASIAVPILFAAAAAYYGKDIVKKAEEFLKQGDTIKKAKQGDANAIKNIADTLATVIVTEKDEAEAAQALENEELEGDATQAANDVRDKATPANRNEPPPGTPEP